MAFKDTLQVSAAPVFLRVVLGFVMLWSGVGKLFTTQQVSPEDAAILASMGVVGPSSSPVRYEESPHERAEGVPLLVLGDEPPPPLKVRHARASDFAEGARVSSVYSTALLIHKASFPEHGMRIWPPKVDTQPWPVIFAWGVAFILTIGGAALLAGVFTRFFAFAVGTVLLGALWLTQLGPAMQSDAALFGILPVHGTFDFEGWMPFGSLVVLLAISASLVCSGAGGMSVDRMVGGGGKPAGKPKES